MKLPWKRGPKHCKVCGDEFVESTYRDGYNERTGALIERTWSHCPRTRHLRPGTFAEYGECHSLAPWACAVERALYAAHKPPICRHRGVNTEGTACWDERTRPITLNGVALGPFTIDKSRSFDVGV